MKKLLIFLFFASSCIAQQAQHNTSFDKLNVRNTATLSGGLNASQAGTFNAGPNLYHQFLLNSCNPGIEFQNFQASSALTEALTACSTVPNGGTLTQSNAIGAYTVGNAGNTIGQVALYGQARGNSVNARVWGLNAVVFDTAGNTSPNLYAAELDTEIVNAGSAGFGANVVGVFKAQPFGGSAVAIQTTQVAPCTTCAWPFGLRLSTGATLSPALGQGGVYLFPQATGSSQPSQSIVLQATDSGAAAQTNIITELATGDFSVATSKAGAGITTNGPLKTGSTIQNQAGTTTMSLTLKKGSGGGNYTNATTSYTVADSTNLCFAVTIPTGWKLGIQASGGLGTSTAVVEADVALTDNAACSTANSGILTEAPVFANAAGNTEPFSLNWVIAGDGNAHNVALQFKTTNVADTANLLNSSATKLPTMIFTLMPSN